eukprot:463837_1
MATLQSWLKKQGLYDNEIYRVLDARGVKDPFNDFSLISKKEWAKLKKEIIFEKKKQIKDVKTIIRLEQKLAKVGKQWKSQQGKKKKKKKKKTAKIFTRDDTPPPTNAKGKGKKANKKEKSFKPSQITMIQITTILDLWTRSNKICRKLSGSIYVMICKYFPLFGFGADGTLIVGTKKVHTLRSNNLYNFKSIILKKNAKLTVDIWKTKAPLHYFDNLDGSGGRLLINCSGSLIMNEGSTLTVKACGYPGGHGKGVNGGKGMGFKGNGGEAGILRTSATGGLYGKTGICENLDKVTTAKELILGSGGGGITGDTHRLQWFDPVSPGGSGGGILKLQCNRLVMKGNKCVISANGQTSPHGGGGSGGVLWIQCLEFINRGKDSKLCAKGGRGDGDEYSGGKEQGDDGRIRIDTLYQKDKQKMEKIVLCDNVVYGTM